MECNESIHPSAFLTIPEAPAIITELQQCLNQFNWHAFIALLEDEQSFHCIRCYQLCYCSSMDVISQGNVLYYQTCPSSSKKRCNCRRSCGNLVVFSTWSSICGCNSRCWWVGNCVSLSMIIATVENIASFLSCENIIMTGTNAPDFSLPSNTGKDISLKSLAGKRTVLYFYPVRKFLLLANWYLQESRLRRRLSLSYPFWDRLSSGE